MFLNRHVRSTPDFVVVKMARFRPPSLQVTPDVLDSIPVELVPKVWVGSIHCACNQEALIERFVVFLS